MKLTHYIFIFCSLIFSKIEAQQNFQKVYTFQDTFAIFNDVFVTDSCYYYTAGIGSGLRQPFNFGKIHLDGAEEILLLDEDPSSFQRIMFSQADMDTNFRGNFVTCFVNHSINGNSPRIKEFSSDANLVSDFALLDYWTTDSLYFINEFSRIIINNIDSTYLIAHRYHDNKTDNNGNEQNGSCGTILIKLKFDGTVIWDKKFYYSPIGLYKPDWALSNLIKLPNDEFLLVINEFKIFDPANWNLNWTKTHFIKLDINGNQVAHKIFQDGQYSPGGFAGTHLEDGGLLYSYFESIIDGSPPNTDYFRPRPVIARFDNNYNLVWKKSLREFYGTDFSFFIGQMTEIRIVEDSLFVGAFNYIEEIEENMAYKERLRLSQYNLNGENKWNRDYIYYPTDDYNDPEYGIYDLELTPDGGYIMLGEVQILDSLLTNAPGQFGYVLKTNCLGFLGDPIAEYAYSTNFGDVQFVNNSIQAGSYKWIFGDGDTLSTSEYIDSVKHNYLNNGNYTVQLIAYGCNGINDTIEKTIQVSGISNGFAGDGTLLTIFPNPNLSGESIAFYVGNITQENVNFEIVNALGQIVFQGKIQLPNTTYIIPFNFASGQYFVSLKNDKLLLETEKLIIFN